MSGRDVHQVHYSSAYIIIGQLQSVLCGNNGGVLVNDSVINTLMFADDIVLLSTSGDGLRRHLSSLESLCKELKMEVNTARKKHK